MVIRHAPFVMLVFGAHTYRHVDPKKVKIQINCLFFSKGIGGINFASFWSFKMHASIVMLIVACAVFEYRF